MIILLTAGRVKSCADNPYDTRHARSSCRSTPPDTLPAHLYDTQAEFGALLQRAINLRAGSLGHPWYRRQYERAGMRFWLGLVASNMRGWRRLPADTPKPPEGPR